MIYVLMADGCEEIEALTPVDLLRRGGVQVRTVGMKRREIQGAHGIVFQADIQREQLSLSEMEGIVLPGGLEGTEELDRDPLVHQLIDDCMERALLVAAICAAPRILGKRGLLKGRKATVYPSFQKELQGALLSKEPVCQDGNIVTAVGMGASVAFGAKLLELLKGTETARRILSAIQYDEHKGSMHEQTI